MKRPGIIIRDKPRYCSSRLRLWPRRTIPHLRIGSPPPNKPCKVWNPEPRTERIRDVVGTLQGWVRIGTGHLENGPKTAKPRCGIRWRICRGQAQRAWCPDHPPDGMRVEGDWRNDRLLTGDIRDFDLSLSPKSELTGWQANPAKTSRARLAGCWDGLRTSRPQRPISVGMMRRMRPPAHQTWTHMVIGHFLSARPAPPPSKSS